MRMKAPKLKLVQKAQKHERSLNFGSSMKVSIYNVKILKIFQKLSLKLLTFPTYFENYKLNFSNFLFYGVRHQI